MPNERGTQISLQGFCTRDKKEVRASYTKYSKFSSPPVCDNFQCTDVCKARDNNKLQNYLKISE